MTKADYKTLEEVAKNHERWIKICKTYVGVHAEDMVQDAYLKLALNGALKRIGYNDTINEYFIYLTLRSVCLDFLRKRKPMQQIETTPIRSDQKCEAYNAMDILFYKIHKEIEKWNAYDARLFELYLYSGLSYRDISHGTDKTTEQFKKDKRLSDLAIKRGSRISVNSIYTTLKKCKGKLKEELGEDFQDYFNGDFQHITL